MSPRRLPSRSSPGFPRVPEAGPQGALLRKYQELTTKHEALVHRLEARNEEHISSYQLSTWALETTASALVLLRAGSTLQANRRWHALARTGPWQLLSQGKATGLVMATLRQVACHEAGILLASEDRGVRVQRYQKQGSDETLEIRVERAGPQAPVRPTQMALALIHDVTQEMRHTAELEQARASLARQEQMKTLGEMSSGIAHDLNNTLNAMRLRLELLQRDAAVTALQAHHLKALMQIVSDAGLRVRHLQEFSRQQTEPSQERALLHDVAREATELARDSIAHQARTGVKVHLVNEVPVLPAVNGEPSDLRYVFLNLLLNARDAMPRGGTVYLRGSASRSRVVITVEDEGTGIAEAHLDKLFLPFFTTKGNKGTGLGLSMAYGAVSRTGGTLTAGNRPKGGAVFTLTFPIPPAAPVPAPAPELLAFPLRPPLSGHVLLIDAEPASREALRLALESLGVSVEAVNSGAAALKKLRKGVPWDAVFCDLELPGMSGWTVAQRMKKRAPRLPLYLMTARPPKALPEAKRSSNVLRLLPKPLALEPLWEALWAVLPGKARAPGGPRLGSTAAPGFPPRARKPSAGAVSPSWPPGG
ncbi:hybrid sensor histidine kinase/response regulator [Stigmatella hybrida]|uniref:hybrid sensor histidine kinase/response regulator n=1 Tax=Stigmatella hybrida TaxID=394097 RepID=UPI001CDAAD2B|nr:ATP-binding protein [Stigmatella hybrida]